MGSPIKDTIIGVVIVVVLSVATPTLAGVVVDLPSDDDEIEACRDAITGTGDNGKKSSTCMVGGSPDSTDDGKEVLAIVAVSTYDVVNVYMGYVFMLILVIIVALGAYRIISEKLKEDGQ